MAVQSSHKQRLAVCSLIVWHYACVISLRKALAADDLPVTGGTWGGEPKNGDPGPGGVRGPGGGL